MLALGLLLQPVMASGSSHLEKGLTLPLPDDPFYRNLVATFWLDLVTRLAQLAGIAIRRKQDETALRESEARFRSLFDNVVDGVYQAAPSGELLSANPALVQMLGLEMMCAAGMGDRRVDVHG